MKFEPTNTLSGRGDGPGLFQVRITGLAVEEEGTLYALGDRQVCVFDPGGGFVRNFSTTDAGWSIARSENGLWIGLQGAIEQVDRHGRVTARIVDPRLGRVTGVAVLGETLLAADATHRRLSLFERGAWRRFVGLESNTRGFMIPNGVLVVAADSQRRQFVVAHPQKHRVERYELDGTPAGTFGKFGQTSPADFGGCCNPNTIAMNSRGVVFVSEKAPPAVKAYSRDGALLGISPGEAFEPAAKNLALAATTTRALAADPTRCVIEAFDLIASDGDEAEPSHD